MSNRLLIHGSTLEENEIYSLEVITDEYISDQTSFPLKKDDNLSNLYISQDKLNNLTQLIKEKVIQKLIPGLQKEGYQENITGGNDATSNITPPIHDNYNDSSRNVNLTEPSFNPFAYGDRDLNPLGGMGTAPGLPRFGGGGMFLGPNHPIFSPDHPSAPRNPGSLPPHAIPPGARFDPITPLGPRVNPNSQREQRPTFSGEPDNDELPPPGYNNMFM
ncbi:hypothetical protein K502DRAFT_305283 [Neoconidiobolus thromboides FSU 785]|nr:hypothetical protein K502DRAFT_305283 [Neoconidiobolus thromboides FSU 785]